MKRRTPVICSEERCASPVIKRTKVQAQRKFAQGSNNFTYSSTKITSKSQETNGFTTLPAPQPPTNSDNDECELNNFSSLPSVDDFLTFLCFRETEVLPERLNYLNTPQFDEPAPKKKCLKSVNLLPNQNSINEKKNDRSSKMKAAKSHLKPNIPEYKLRSHSVKSKNIVPKSSRYLALKHNQRLRSKSVVKAKCVENKLSLKTKNSMANRILPPPKTHPVKVKSGLILRKNRPLTRALERKESSPLLSNHSDFRRITRRNSIFDKPPEPSSGKNAALLKKPVIPKSTTSSDAKKTNTESSRCQVKKSPTKCLRISLPKTDVTTLDTSLSSKPVTRSARCSEATPTTSTSSRPSRRTKEAATLYMVMLGKDLLCPEENFEDDDNISIKSFPELPNTEEHMRREKEIKELNQKKNAEKTPPRKTSSPKAKILTKLQDGDPPKPFKDSVKAPVKIPLFDAKPDEVINIGGLCTRSKQYNTESDTPMKKEQSVKIIRTRINKNDRISTFRRRNSCNDIFDTAKHTNTVFSQEFNRYPCPKGTENEKKSDNESVTIKRLTSVKHAEDRLVLAIEKKIAKKPSTAGWLPNASAVTKFTPCVKPFNSNLLSGKKAVVSKKPAALVACRNINEASKSVLNVKPLTANEFIEKKAEGKTPTVSSSDNVSSTSKFADTCENSQITAASRNTVIDSSANAGTISKIAQKPAELKTLQPKISHNKELETSQNNENLSKSTSNSNALALKRIKNEKSIARTSQKSEEIDESIQEVTSILASTVLPTEADSQKPIDSSQNANEIVLKSVKHVVHTSTETTTVADTKICTAKSLQIKVPGSAREETRACQSTILPHTKLNLDVPQTVEPVSRLDRGITPVKPNLEIIKNGSKTSAKNTEEISSSIQPTIKFVQRQTALPKNIEIKEVIADSSQGREANTELTNEREKPFVEFPQNIDGTKFQPNLKSRSNPVIFKKIDKKKSLINSSHVCGKLQPNAKLNSNPVVLKKIEHKKPVVDALHSTENVCKSIQKVKPVRSKATTSKIAECKEAEVESTRTNEKHSPSASVDVDSKTGAFRTREIPEKPEPEPSSLNVSDGSVTSNEENEKTPHRCDSTRPGKKEAMARIKHTDFKLPPVHPKMFFSNLKGTKEEKPTIQTVVSSNNKVYNLESKKIIFKKNTTPVFAEEKEDISARKSEAFSPDNENSVYAFEPDLPTTSPPFRRLKPVTPPKSVVSNSIAVQVNFEDAKVECSSSGDTQVSSTTDCGDHVFYIPIQTSDTTSTLGVAVKLDTDGPNQKIIMSAKLITSTQTLTTSTSTSATKSIAMETSCTQTDGVKLSSTEKILKPMAPAILAAMNNTDKIVTSTDMQTIQIPCSSTSSSSDKVDKPAPVKTAPQSVKIVKLNKNRKSKITKLELQKAKPKPVKTKSVKKPVAEIEKKPEKVPPKPVGEILEAPTFYPTAEEFNDPLEYIDTIRPVAEKFGLCRIVPPSNFRPECKVADEMRFTAYNQYVHKMLHRWGPNVKEMMAIKKFLRTHNITLTQAPLIGGMEVDLPRLYQIVQQCGGLNAIIEKERWHQVADIMRIPKLAQDRITKLDDIYCKYLLPYDVLSHGEREKLFEEIEKEWTAHLENPTDDEVFDDIDECILKGRTMPLSCFYRIARNTTMMCFGSVEGQEGPSTEKIEEEFWNHVSNRKSHICVHSGSIDSGTYGYGFSVDKKSTFRKHPWNLKVFTNNAASILRSLGPVMGVTVPTLHVGMLYSACCWYRDPHGLPWIEYLHAGANKIWYGIPDEHSEYFKDALSTLVPRYCKDKKIWLPSDTVMIPPPLLTHQNVSLSRVVQHPGQFVVVFPKAFTSSIATGYLVSESVYFAHASWLNSAKQIFKDMQDSCEPSGFSLEQLVIFIAEDARSSNVILNKVLPLLVDLRDTEVALRNQLKELGLNTFEKLNVSKKRKSKTAFLDDEVYECDNCRKNLFVSLVVNFDEQSSFCPRHAATMLFKKPSVAKNFKLLYAYTDNELDVLVEKVKSKVLQAKGSKKTK